MEDSSNSINELSSYWIDVTNPSEKELLELATKYALHPNAVQDCLEPDHLPKYEETGNSSFVVLRVYDTMQTSDADTIQEVTRKIAIFILADKLITVHRTQQPILEGIQKKYVDSNRCNNKHELLLHILNASFLSYDEPSDKLVSEIDFYETRIFLKTKLPNLLKNLYHIKRKVSVIRRILTLSKEITNKVEEGFKKDAMYREMRDNYVQQITVYDQLNEDINNLLSLYLSISGQRTNEVIRVLTIFSVFFMPLTFIVGIYGMNFDHMPELRWEYGYLFSFGVMTLVTAVIYLWFKRKKWL
jgi:magnesium transporter